MMWLFSSYVNQYLLNLESIFSSSAEKLSPGCCCFHQKDLHATIPVGLSEELNASAQNDQSGFCQVTNHNVKKIFAEY